MDWTTIGLFPPTFTAPMGPATERIGACAGMGPLLVKLHCISGGLMKRIRPLLFLCFGALLAVSFIVTRSDAQPNTMKQIAPGVWFREGDILKEGHCNNVVIEMKDSLIVVDANFPSGARRVMEDAKKVSSKPVKYVFDTHHHGDHAYGNAVWTQAGAVTLAYLGGAGELKRYEPGRVQAT